MILLAPLAFAFACAFMVGAVATRGDPLVASRLGAAPDAAAATAQPAFVSRVGNLPFVRRATLSKELESRRIASGWKVSAEQFTVLKVISALGGLMTGVFMPGAVRAISPLLALVGFRVPDVFLKRAARKRLRAADSEIPQLLDLLAAGSTAGLAAQLALVRACPGLRGPLAEEIGVSMRAVEFGRRWRDELVGLAERLDLPDMRRVVAVLTRTEMLGTPLTGSLTDLAADVRSARAAAASERARKAPVKMLFPLVFLVLPAFLLLTVVPVLLSTIRSIS
jgi:tight adherence protein C